MMGRTDRDQSSFFYEFHLDDMIPKGHLLRRIDVFVTVVVDVRLRSAMTRPAKTLTRVGRSGRKPASLLMTNPRCPRPDSGATLGVRQLAEQFRELLSVRGRQIETGIGATAIGGISTRKGRLLLARGTQAAEHRMACPQSNNSSRERRVWRSLIACRGSICWDLVYLGKVSAQSAAPGPRNAR